MKNYDVYKSPLGEIEAVKNGWSWPGFVFLWMWAFVKGLYGVGVGILIASIILGLLHTVIGIISTILFSLWLGSSGNKLRIQNLRKRGYESVLTLAADTPEGAIALYTSKKDISNVNQAPSEKRANSCYLCGAKVNLDSACEACHKSVCLSHSNYASGKKYCFECLKNITSITPANPISQKSNLTNCLDCKKEISARAVTCPHCGCPMNTNESIHLMRSPEPKKEWSPGIAAVLSLIIPGAGQMYKGQISTGLTWLLFVVIGYMLFVVPGLILHLICIFRAATVTK